MSCNHAYSSMTILVSCHEDLTAEECRISDQRSAWTCSRPKCLVSTVKWVKASGHQPVLKDIDGNRIIASVGVDSVLSS